MTVELAGGYELEMLSNPPLDHIYDFRYDADEYCSSYMQIGIYKGEEILKTVLLGSEGGGTGVHETSFIIEPDRVLICCSNSVFCLSIADLNLLWRTRADSATCFEIFNYEDGYIVHGELEISRLGRDGAILWQQSGADIFTTSEGGKNDFLITGNYILATDWHNRKYKFDFDGNIIL